MSLFLSTFEKKIDKKGRASVPSNFRNVLAPENYNGIIAYSSFINDSIEACGISRIEKMSENIDSLDPFSEEHEAFSTTILGGSIQLPFDREGRITLPQSLLENASIEGELIFVGKGKTFEIWNPTSFKIYADKAREKALNNRKLLRNQNI